MRMPVNSGLGISAAFQWIGARRLRASSMASSGFAFCSPCCGADLVVIGAKALDECRLEPRVDQACRPRPPRARRPAHGRPGSE